MTKTLNLTIYFCLLSIYAISQNYYWYNKTKISLTKDPSVSFLKLNFGSEKQSLTKRGLASLLRVNDSSLYAISDSEFISIATPIIDSKSLLSQ